MTATASQPGLRRTPLYDAEAAAGATFADFAGWSLPLRYRSETEEHRTVRSAAGLFDLSHMGEIAVTGPGAAAALDFAVVGHVSTMEVGRARYTLLCTDSGGILDDFIVYRTAPEEFLVVANAANVAVVLDQLRERAAGHDAQVTDRSLDYALIGVQGPRSPDVLRPVLDVDPDVLKYYTAEPARAAGCPVLLARTGYTGEIGYELFVAAGDAVRVWEATLAAGRVHGLAPAGLAARDSLRLEAGMPLYGNELGLDRTPFDAGLDRFVRLDKAGDFVGRQALAARAGAEPSVRLVGLVASGRRVLRHGHRVLDTGTGEPVGAVTSGAPSPTLGRPIAMAYVDPAHAEVGTAVAVDVRGNAEPAEVTRLPFYSRTR